MTTTTMVVSEEGGVHVVAFAKDTELDAANVDDVQRDLFALAEADRGRRILLDLENVRYASSRALGTLVTLRLKAARVGAIIVLSGVSESLAEIVHLTQIDKLYETFPTRAEALRRLAS